MSRILFVLTSHDQMLDGSPTGVWLEEFAVPYLALVDAGHDIAVSSVKGGEVPVDPNSKPTEQQATDWAKAIQRLKNTEPFDQFRAEDFDALYIPGGHGTVFDLPDNPRLQALIKAFDRDEKIIAAVCHGPAAFTSLKREDGTPWIKGRKVCAFTDAEELEAGGFDKVPFLLETRLKELGAEHEGVDNWKALVAQDGHLITGQNPQSSAEVAYWLRSALVSTV